jgi:hypothetical protein
MSAVNDPTPPQPNPPGSEAIQAGAPPAAAPTGIQATTPPEAPPIPLPPRPRAEPITPEELGRAMTRLDRMLLALIVVLTALVAVFPIRNSDFWFHLATARDWLAGKFHLGQDPYSFTGNGTWVNHSWLYDLLVYGLYQMFGGPAVIVVKAVLLLGLVIVMLSIRRRGQSLWLPGVCTALAVLAMSPGFVMQPAVVSLVLLGVTLAVLLRRDIREEPEADRKHRLSSPVPWLGEPADRPLWLLVPLFALWVNLDAWFVLGPLAVALYLAGSLAEAFFALGKPNAPRPGTWRPLAAVLAAGVLACLLSPFHVNGLNLPGEIGARGVLGRLAGDDYFARLLGSPLQGDYFIPEIGLNLAGLAYFPLVLVGLISFVLSGGRVRRAVLWAGFLVLSLAHARAIPFFAVVAGPVAALNFQEYAARRWGTTPVAEGWLKEWSLLGRGLSVLAAFALALLAWPGWLFTLPWESRAPGAEERRVGLVAEPPPGLTRLASRLDDWHHDGTLTDDDHGLNLEPDVTGPLAWLCKEYRPRSFFDYRFENFPPEVAGEYVELRRLFEPSGTDASVKALAQEADRWRPMLAKRGVSYVIASDGARGGYLAVRARCAGIGGSPTLVALHEDGHSAVFAPRGEQLKPRGNDYLNWLRERGLTLPPLPPPAGDQGRFKGKEFDAWALAFGPQAEPLPDAKPKRAQPQPWYVQFAFGSGEPAAAAADAAAFRASAEDTAYRHHYESVMRPAAAFNFAGLFALAGARSGNAVADAWTFGLPFHWVMLRQGPPLEGDDLGPIFIGPSAPLVLAVRSARRAILENPQDAEGYFQLGLAYLALGRQSDEHYFGARMQVLRQVRQVQTVAALRTAATLNPDHVGAHFYLYILFRRAGYTDLQLKHLDAEIKAIRRAPPRSLSELQAFRDRYALGYRLPIDPSKAAEAMKAFEEQLKGMDEERTKLEKTVKDNLNTYAVRTEKKRVMEKARIALELGLGEKALQALLDSDSLEFGKEGALLELDLLMRQGRLDELREQLAPEKEDIRKQLPEDMNSSLGAGSYETYRMLLAVAEGDYKEADAQLEEAAKKAIGDPKRLQMLRVELGVDLKDAGQGKDLSLRQLLAVGVAKLVADELPQGAPVAWLLSRRIVRDQRLGQLAAMAGPLSVWCDLETLRGVLLAEAGHLDAAKKHFRVALFGEFNWENANMDDLPVIDFPGLALAYRYLHVMEKKE